MKLIFRTNNKEYSIDDFNKNILNIFLLKKTINFYYFLIFLLTKPYV